MRNDVTDDEIQQLPGWFRSYDIEMFRLLLDATASRGPGDLAELGVYLGKSAVLVGASQGPEEVFTAVDLFGDTARGDANQLENDDQYPGLTRAAFERNYERFHGELPQIVQGLSRTIVDHARHGSHRFVHVDASHLYEHVVEDIDAARTLLRPDGVVVFDDIRSEHTPGVAAAVWQAMADGLRPFAITPVKLYGTFGDAREWTVVVRDWARRSRWDWEVQRIGEEDVVRLWQGSGSQGDERMPSAKRKLWNKLRNLV